METTEPIIEKSTHLREKGGVLMLFQTTRHLGAKAQYTNLVIMILNLVTRVTNF
jgi:hypothetical protein